MTEIEEMQQAVSGLPDKDFWAFKSWFDELAADRWDQQIERDAASGRLDKLLAKVEADIAAGNTTPL